LRKDPTRQLLSNIWGHELGMMGDGDGDRAAAAAAVFLLLTLMERFLNFESARDYKRYGGHGGIRYWAFGAQDGRRVG
jgi:hypothetical protein